MKGRATITTLARGRHRAGCVAAALAVAVTALALAAYARQDYRARFARAAGELVAVRDSTEIGHTPDGFRVTDVTLVSDTGLEVRARVRAPGLLDGVRHPAAIVVGGYKTGRRVAEIPPATGGFVLASIEYPYRGPVRPRGIQWLPAVPKIRRSMMQTTPALLLLAQYLYVRDDIDPEQVWIIGGSLGAPFAVIAAATDHRLSGAVLIHGGGNARAMFATAFEGRVPRWAMGGVSRAVALLLAPVEPTRYVGEIAPRPLLMINATDDELIPRESVLELWRAARRPKRLLWIESNHIALREDTLIAELMDETLAWIAEQENR